MRIDEHDPILETFEKGREVQFTYDGQEMTGYEGEHDPQKPFTHAWGVTAYIAIRRKSANPEHRLVAIGQYVRTLPLLVVNGKTNIRTCITPLEEGMVVETQYGTGSREDAENDKTL